MYCPAPFSETRPEIIAAAMAEHPLATLVTTGAEGLGASHIPLLYYPAEGSPGVLRGHMARANSQWRDYLPGSEALAIFHGPHRYISPAWYPSTKEHGKVVPTWNYVAVHAHGTLSFRSDAAWLLENVRALTEKEEAANQTTWHVDDAPPEFIQSMVKAIVGVELTITRLEGKWKVSQNRSMPDREGVVVALQKLDSPEARTMAELVKARMDSHPA